MSGEKPKTVSVELTARELRRIIDFHADIIKARTDSCERYAYNTTDLQEVIERLSELSFLHDSLAAANDVEKAA